MTVSSIYPNKQPLDAQRLRTFLDYDPETGLFRWKISRGYRAVPGATAGRSASNGYWEIGIDYKRYRAHRLAWLYVFGHWPKGEIDHINRIKTDNRISNLRDVDRSMNCANVQFIAGPTGIRGVRLYKAGSYQRYSARISVNNNQIHLGYFDTAEEASEAYRDACIKYRGEIQN